MEKEIIKLKGTIDGVKIYLDADCSVSDITASLYEKLRQFRSFFGDGHCNIYFVGRELTASDKMRLEAIVSAMLPESAINYGERKRVKNDDYKERTLKLPEDLAAFEKTDTNDGDKPFEKIKEVVTTNFKSSRARFYEGTVRGGKTLESDGHLVLVGDVEEGARIAAVGNVIVLGSVNGAVEAGCMGNDSAYIIALRFSPSEIRIAKTRRGFNRDDFAETGAKKAFLINNDVYIEDFSY